MVGSEFDEVKVMGRVGDEERQGILPGVNVENIIRWR